MIKTAILGATGLVGQKLINRLSHHPWCTLTHLLASEASRGLTLGEALQWEQDSHLSSLPLLGHDDFIAHDVDIIFSAMGGREVKEREAMYARTTPVMSTTSAFRQDPYTPLMICGVNHGHAPLLYQQQKAYGWKGFVAPKPNCTSVGLALSLKPFFDRCTIKRVVLTSLQALSGAGRHTGPRGLDIMDNVLPFIEGEEEKVETEPQKILGHYTGKGIEPASFSIAATCLRVPVLEGHLLNVHVETEELMTKDAVEDMVGAYAADGAWADLPQAPGELIYLTQDPMRPQPRLDRDRGGGMTVTMGRLGPSSLFSHGFRYQALIANTELGAAGGVVFLAEYLIKHVLQWV